MVSLPLTPFLLNRLLMRLKQYQPRPAYYNKDRTFCYYWLEAKVCQSIWVELIESCEH